MENIFKNYAYDTTTSTTESVFDVTLSGEALLQNDMIGDMALRIGKNYSSGLISGIFAQMTVASIINIKANFAVEVIKNSVEFNGYIPTNINPNGGNYSTNTLNWAF